MAMRSPYPWLLTRISSVDIAWRPADSSRFSASLHPRVLCSFAIRAAADGTAQPAFELPDDVVELSEDSALHLASIRLDQGAVVPELAFPTGVEPAQQGAGIAESVEVPKQAPGRCAACPRGRRGELLSNVPRAAAGPPS